MMPFIADAALAVGSSPAVSIVAKVTLTAALALAGTRLARGSRASVRHLLLAAAFAVLLVLPIASMVAPSIPVEVPIVAADIAAPAAWVDFRDAAAAAEPPHSVLAIASSIPRSPRLSASALLLAGWLAGATMFLLPIGVGLWQMRALRRVGQPWVHGQSVVRQLALDANVNRRIDVLLHASMPGPMTCGVVRPAIVLPADAQAWTADDLRRAIVHELEHVRRGDWLTQGLARTVCACYWFHPLVWIAWRQLALEAERACDDAVLRRADATAYAEQLVALAKRLSTARQPLPAMASRANLARRVAAVLDSRQPRGRAGAFAVALVCAGSALIIATMSPLRIVTALHATTPSGNTLHSVGVTSALSVIPNVPASGAVRARDPLMVVQPTARADQAQADTSGPVARPQFEVASIKPCAQQLSFGRRGDGPGRGVDVGGPGGASPGRLTLNCRSLKGLIQAAYQSPREPVAFGESVQPTPVEGGPDWVTSERYTIEAKADDGSTSTGLMRGPMMQALLEDRFKLKIHRQTREIPIWALTLAKGGPKLARFQEGSCIPVVMTALPTPQPLAPGETRCEVMAGLSGPHMAINAQGVTIDEFSRVFLSIVAGRPIIDKTGLTGRFTIDLEYAPPPVDPARTGLAALQAAAGEPTAPEIFTAIQEQLGLKLEPAKGPGEFLVIDYVERPSEN